MRKIIAAPILAISLTACTADSVQVDVRTSQIEDAVAGEEVWVPFDAKFSFFGSLDDARRSELTALEAIVRDSMAIDDFFIEQSGSTVDVTIEGELPLRYGSDSVAEAPSPWVVAVRDTPDAELAGLFPLTVQLTTSEAFTSFSERSRGISYMSSPDAVQPVRFRLRSNSGTARILAGGFQEGAETHMLAVIEIPSDESRSLLFNDGAYGRVGGGFALGLTTE